jgi:hypothetical protein
LHGTFKKTKNDFLLSNFFKILGDIICFWGRITSLAVGLKFKSFLGLTYKNIKYFFGFDLAY